MVRVPVVLFDMGWFNSRWCLLTLFFVEWWAKWANNELWGLFSAEWWANRANNELWGLFSVEWWAEWVSPGGAFWHGVVRFPVRVFLTCFWIFSDFDVLTQDPSRKVREGPRSIPNPLTNYMFLWFLHICPYITIAYSIAIGLPFGLHIVIGSAIDFATGLCCWNALLVSCWAWSLQKFSGKAFRGQPLMSRLSRPCKLDRPLSSSTRRSNSGSNGGPIGNTICSHRWSQ